MRNSKCEMRNAGFTLLEVMVALMILIVGLVSIFSLFSTATRSHRQAITNATLSRYASTVLAELESGKHPAGIDFRDRFALAHPDFPALYKYDLRFKPIPDPLGGSNEVGVTIIIKWSQGTKIVSEQFQAVLLKR